ncbi:uncharacterized protein BJ212DRAFT_1480207 [Suillus subaureus]|uniref:Uncharacterized protein n=1 Tax=Suillus subaureus TaxID=48587 RepID=A0A9P7ECW7_9AGAM|nr:uncharacterized protein BJ212DRAFT_1480207 [Suillus subaureus]KAG1817646.1 hypothetical protein BJ212DRAFT_1480207 [Suillus subaureus]
MPLQLKACHPGEEAEEEENLPVLAMHFERDSAEPYYLFNQLEEDNSDLALKAAQVKHKWKYVNLGKVLDSVHTTELDPKKTHVIDDEIELALWVSKSSGGIKTSSDHNIAFSMYIEAIAFVFPQCSNTFEQHSSPLLALVPILPHPQLGQKVDQIGKREIEEGMIPVTNGIEVPAPNQMVSVISLTAATKGDVRVLTENLSAQTKELLNEGIMHGQRFRHKGVWGLGVSFYSRTALWTETVAPMSQPPVCKFSNLDAMNTIQTHPSLFKVSTPIKVDIFEALSADHPNPSFVHSVCDGLCERFWPFADTHPNEWPLVFDNLDWPPKTDAKKEFLCTQIEKEVDIGHYSQAFGPGLLPGMYSMPIHAVLKPGTNKHQLVTDHSAGIYMLNSMISHNDIAGVTLDNVHDLVNGLCAFRHT